MISAHPYLINIIKNGEISEKLNSSPFVKETNSNMNTRKNISGEHRGNEKEGKSKNIISHTTGTLKKTAPLVTKKSVNIPSIAIPH